jgi:hypothetical protein
LAGESTTLESLWKSRLGLLGKTVHVEGVQQAMRGRLLDVTLDRVDLDIGGEVISITPESVKHIHAD